VTLLPSEHVEYTACMKTSVKAEVSEFIVKAFGSGYACRVMIVGVLLDISNATQN
jgi:hypothetical protein